VTDAVVPGGNCFQVSTTKIGCPADTSNTTRLEVTTGSGDDSVVVDLPVRAASGVASIFVYGGPGQDSITGSEGPDTLEGDGLTGTGRPIAAAGTRCSDTGWAGPDRRARRSRHAARRARTRLPERGTTTTAVDAPNTLDGGTESDFFDVGTTLGPDRVIGGANEPPSLATRIQFGNSTFSVAGGDTCPTRAARSAGRGQPG
jgi:hypothetical protein